MSLSLVLLLLLNKPKLQLPYLQLSLFTSPLYFFFNKFNLPLSLSNIHDDNNNLFRNAALLNKELLVSIAKLEAVKLEAIKDNNNFNSNFNFNNSNNSNLLSTQR
jgi:hypothetical protein